jgi:hypothetical protein
MVPEDRSSKVASIALNAAKAQGNAGGNARVRFESARGSLSEAQAGVRVALTEGYVTQTAAAPVLESMHSLGGRVFGLCRRLLGLQCPAHLFNGFGLVRRDESGVEPYDAVP